jgi:hypothetical protein
VRLEPVKGEMWTIHAGDMNSHCANVLGVRKIESGINLIEDVPERAETLTAKSDGSTFLHGSRLEQEKSQYERQSQ